MTAPQGEQDLPILPATRLPARDPTEERMLILNDFVFRWLGIAEQRSNWLILLGAAAQAVLLSVITSTTDQYPRYFMGLAAAVMMSGLMVSVASFFPLHPVTRRLARVESTPTAQDDLYFYGHLSRYQPDELVRAIERAYLGIPENEIVVSRAKHDLAEQIVLCATMTTIKMRLFTFALLAVATGALIALAAALVALAD